MKNEPVPDQAADTARGSGGIMRADTVAPPGYIDHSDLSGQIIDPADVTHAEDCDLDMDCSCLRWC